MERQLALPSVQEEKSKADHDLANLRAAMEAWLEARNSIDVGHRLIQSFSTQILISEFDLAVRSLRGKLRDELRELRGVTISDKSILTQEGWPARSPWSSERATYKHLLDRAEKVYAQAAALEASLSKVDSAQDIALLVPSQMAAPLRVRLDKAGLVLAAEHTAVGLQKQKGLQAIRHGAAEILLDLISDLESSNADRRAIRALAPFARHLQESEESFSPEALGINRDLAEHLFENFGDEISPIAQAQMREVLTSTSVLLSQYSEWREYQAAKAEHSTTQEASRELAVETKRLSENLRASNTDVVHPAILERLCEIVDPVVQGLAQAEVFAPALIASLSNFFAGVVELLLSSNTAEFSAYASGVMPTGLWFLYQLLNKHAAQLRRYPGLAFLGDAVTYLARAIKFFKDTMKGE